MRGIVVVVAVMIACAACGTSTTQSTLPPYVRDLRPVAGGLLMTQCEAIYTKTEDWGFGWSWRHLFSWQRQTETDLRVGQCWNHVVSTEVAP